MWRGCQLVHLFGIFKNPANPRSSTELSQESHEPFTDSIVNEPGGKDDNYRMRYSNEPENKGKERKKNGSYK